MKEIALTKGKSTFVDDEDFVELCRYKWCARKDYRTSNWYAARGENGKMVQMHRQILGLTFGDRQEGDHRDGDGLNNQRYNLRICSRLQNGRNLRVQTRVKYSKFKGVSLKQHLKKPWVAHIMVSGILHHLAYSYPEQPPPVPYTLPAP